MLNLLPEIDLRPHLNSLVSFAWALYLNCCYCHNFFHYVHSICVSLLFLMLLLFYTALSPTPQSRILPARQNRSLQRQIQPLEWVCMSTRVSFFISILVTQIRTEFKNKLTSKRRYSGSSQSRHRHRHYHSKQSSKCHRNFPSHI